MLYMPKKLLMLQLLVAKADQAFQANLVSHPVIAAKFKHLCVDEALDQTEDVGISTALDLTQVSFLIGQQEIHLVDLTQTIRQEFVREAERASPNDVLIYVPPHPF